MEKTIEEMKSLANSSYSKAGCAPPLNSSPLSRERSRKRVKETNGSVFQLFQKPGAVGCSMRKHTYKRDGRKSRRGGRTRSRVTTFC